MQTQVVAIIQVIIFCFRSFIQAIGDGGQGWSNALLYIFLSPTIRRQLFVLPFLRLLHFSIKKAGFSHIIDEPPSDEERRERDTRLPRQGAENGGKLKLGDCSSGLEWDTVDDINIAHA